jgi:carboxyl-terminal processing protease
MLRFRHFLIIVIMISLSISSHHALIAHAEEDEGSSKINEVLQLIKTYHLSGANEDDLTEAAINGMVDSLNDPYTEYFTKEEQAKFLTAIDGGFLGIGITMDKDANGVYISVVEKASPAAQIGLLKGDYLDTINGKKITFDNLDQVFDEALSGKVEGNTIKISIKRGSLKKVFVIPLREMDIPIVRSMSLPQGVGYIALSAFTIDADKAFSAALNELKSKGMKSLIIDLRNNGGGYIETTKAIAAHFMKDQSLMTISDKDGKEKQVMITEGKAADYPIVIIVNEYSASASEVFAGAMQDYKLAQVVGMKTYGKGVTQNIMPLYNGGALKITTEEYFTPNHHPVNHIGIIPNIEAHGDVGQMVKAYYAAGAKKIKLQLTKTDFTINQIEFAGYGLETYIEKDKDIYIPSRLIMALVNGEVAWDNATKSYVFSQAKTKASLPSSSKNIVMRDGINYVSASYIQSKFPQLSWTFTKNIVTLEASH